MISNESERVFELPPSVVAASTDTRGTYDDRLNRILEAAAAVIARDGYEKASMRSVAKAAHVSLAGLYHYFDSKEKMLFLIQFRTFNSLLNGLREKLHGVTDPVRQLEVMVRNHVGYFAANMAALKVCSHELDSLSGEAYDETRSIRRDYYELTRGILDKLLTARDPGEPIDGHVATMSLFGMLNWLYRWYEPKRGRSPAMIADQIVALLLCGLNQSADGQSTRSRRGATAGDRAEK